MSKHRLAVVVLVVVPALLISALMARAQGQTALYWDDFEGYDVGEHPVVWSEIWGDASDVVTDEWAASGMKSFVTVSPSGGWVKRPIIHLGDIGAWPLPEHFFYECTLHMEATSCSNGFVGFMFKDPRYANQVPTENRVGFRADGRIEWGGLTDQVIGQWQPGREATYAVRVDIDFPNETADVWINGELLGEGLPAFPRVIPASSIYGAEIPLDKWGFGVENFSGPGPGRLFIDDISLGQCSPALAAEVDVDPDTLNLRSRGRFITAYIELPEGFDPADIDVEMVYFAVDDSEDFVPAEPRPTAVRDHDRDGVDDLMVKFDRQAVQGLLSAGEEVVVYVGGLLIDATEFLGSDTIRVIDRGAMDFFRKAADTNRAICLTEEKVYQGLTRARGGRALRGTVRRCLRLLERLLRMEVPSGLGPALEEIQGALVELEEWSQEPLELIQPWETALYTQARQIAMLFDTLAYHYRGEARAWQGARSGRSGFSMDDVRAWLEAEPALLGMLSDAVDDFRKQASSLPHAERAQHLVDLADTTDALITGLADYVSAVLEEIASW